MVIIGSQIACQVGPKVEGRPLADGQQRATWSVPLSLVHHGEIGDFVLIVDHENYRTPFRRVD